MNFPPALPLNQLGATLKETREKAGVRVSEITDAAGVSRQFPYSVEAGNERATPRVLNVYAQLCRMSDTDRDWLLLSWGYMVDDIFGLLQRNPELCCMIRAGEILKAELSSQS